MIGVTLGDPAGVGPEIVARSLATVKSDEVVLIGSKSNFLKTISDLRLDVQLNGIKFVDVQGDEVQVGRVQKAGGDIAVRSIVKAVELAKSGQVDSIATAPISREAILMTGSRNGDHNSILSELTGSKIDHTVFETGPLRIFFMTKRVPLVKAIEQVTESRVYSAILEANDCLRLLGLSRRRIGVTSLNPHLGEGGAFGSEEEEAIIPAVKRAKTSIEVFGPYPADIAFHRAAQGAFDIVVAMFYDQGRVASKMLDFERTTSISLGLPFLRTSVDQNAAFEIAGKGQANASGMTEAINKAAEYGKSYRSRYQEIM